MDVDLASEIVWNLMLGYFNGDVEATTAWFEHNNPFIGYTSPLVLMQSGYHEEVLQYADELVKQKVSR